MINNQASIAIRPRAEEPGMEEWMTAIHKWNNGCEMQNAFRYWKWLDTMFSILNRILDSQSYSQDYKSNETNGC